MKLLTIGGATHDMYLINNSLQTIDLHNMPYIILQADSKIEIEKIVSAIGGGAANSAVSFKRLGFDVSIVCQVGDDDAGRRVKKELETQQINTEYVCTSSTGLTGISCIIPAPHGKRTILVFRGVNATLSESQIPFAQLNKFDQLYVTSLSGESSKLLLTIAQKAHELNIPIATNPGGSQLAFGQGATVLFESLPFIDILILNAQEAEQFMHTFASQALKSAQLINPEINEPHLLAKNHSKTFDCVSYCATILAHGPSVVAVTNGAEGVYVATKNRILFHPGFPINVTNTVGAGDSFGSCFVASLAEKKSIEQALVNGMLNSASVISHTNAQEGLLTKAELEKKAAQEGINKIQSFNFELI
jgi:sugar/nucleoside kinase (ribokinase family)